MNFKQPTKLTIALLISVVFTVFLGGENIIWGLMAALLGAIALSLYRPVMIKIKTDLTGMEKQELLLPLSRDNLVELKECDFNLQTTPNTFSSIISCGVAKGAVIIHYAVGKRPSHLRADNDQQFVRLYRNGNNLEVYLKCGKPIGENLVKVSRGKVKSHRDLMWYGIDVRYISKDLLDRLINLSYEQIIDSTAKNTAVVDNRIYKHREGKYE